MSSTFPFSPTEAWQPSVVPWNGKWAAHLYRRAAFGFPPRSFTPGEARPTPWQALGQSVDKSRDDCVDELLAGGAGQEQFNQLLDSTGAQTAKLKFAVFQNPQTEKLRGWWLARMLHTPHPLLERLTVFWHDHFATSLAKVTNWETMFRQNQLLREHALDKFGPMLAGISRDPAMLFWLDSNSNIKGRPNENFAREIMELFSLGVGNYTETDIREAARAFTGWGTAGGEFLFNAALHDNGQKTLLGENGNLDGDDVVRIVLKQPAVARFLVGKLYREFISEAEPPPPPELLEPLADEFRRSGYDIKACLRTMLRSRIFYSDYAYRSRIKSPVEYVVGLVTALEAQIAPAQLALAMDGLGQSLFAPPNVAGWDGGEAWLNSATLLGRHNLAAKLVGGEDNQFSIDVPALAEKYAGKEVKEQVQFLLALFLDDNVPDESRQRILEFADGEEPKDQSKRLREVAHTILLLPEYQLA